MLLETLLCIDDFRARRGKLPDTIRVLGDSDGSGYEITHGKVPHLTKSADPTGSIYYSAEVTAASHTPQQAKPGANQ